MIARLVPALAVIAVVTCARPAAADELRLVVLLTPAQAPWLTRLEGQLADLDVTIDAVVGPAPSSREQALGWATEVLRSHDAVAAAWLMADDGGWWVHVAADDGHRLLVRRVDARTEGLSESAAIESAAMIVRTAMRGLASGVEVGEVVAGPGSAPSDGAAKSDATDATDASDVTKVPAVTAGPGVTTARRALPSSRLWGQLAWSQTVDEPGLGHAAVEVRAGLARGAWRAGLVAAYQPRATTAEPLATIAVSRATGGALVGRDLWRAPRLRVAAELQLSLTRFARTTVATTAPLTPTEEATTWSEVLTPAVRLRWRLADRAWLTVGVGVDVLARPPRFSVATADGTMAVAAPWPVAPRVDLGLIFDPE